MLYPQSMLEYLVSQMGPQHGTQIWLRFRLENCKKIMLPRDIIVTSNIKRIGAAVTLYLFAFLLRTREMNWKVAHTAMIAKAIAEKIRSMK